ncbi:MAG: DUF4426 domain-containing protein [Thiohalomonadales bacterium]
MSRLYKPRLKIFSARVSLLLIISLAIMMLGSPIYAASSDNISTKLKEFGDYTVHFNAFSSDTLQPKMAQAYGITRSKNRGILSISILKKSGELIGTPVKAQITATANNLTGQMKDIPLREINDAGAIYYVSEFRVSHKEMLNFTVEAKPVGSNQPMTVKFRQQFYTD